MGSWSSSRWSTSSRATCSAIFNNISVWWHVIGASVCRHHLWLFLQDGASHWNVSDVFTGTVNNTGGLYEGSTSNLGFWFYVLPLGFLLTQYTITGYDASAHLSEETHGAADAAAKGIWRSIFYSAIGGWILLLSFLFAVQDADAVTAGGGGVQVIFDQALSPTMSGLVLLIATIGQLFCTTACLTSASRMLFAFSRDGAVPGAKYWSKLNGQKTPVYAVLAVAVSGLILTLPALWEVNIGTAEEPILTVTAFFAVVSIGVLGLYLAFAIPIFYRWRAGASFKQGSWNLGNKWKWMAPIAIAEILITSVYFILPLYPAGAPGFMRGFLGAPGTDEVPFDWKFVNYAPLVLGGIFLLLWIGWHVSAKHWFTGPKHTIDLPSRCDVARTRSSWSTSTTASSPGSTRSTTRTRSSAAFDPRRGGWPERSPSPSAFPRDYASAMSTSHTLGHRHRREPLPVVHRAVPHDGGRRRRPGRRSPTAGRHASATVAQSSMPAVAPVGSGPCSISEATRSSGSTPIPI